MEGGVGFSTDGDRPGFTTKGSSYSFGCARCPLVLEGARLGDDLSEMFAEALAEGAGRNGSVKSLGSAEAPLSLKLSTPKTLGGAGDGQNPEQLFAMGYACKSIFILLGSLKRWASLNCTDGS